MFSGRDKPFCREILSLRFPDARIYEDVTTVKGEDLLNDANGSITVLSGGFPCQPISVCGHKKGSQDERWMWNDYYRIIRECHPDWIVIENSPRLYVIPEWRGVQSDLEKAGYEMAYFRIQASGVGAPHVRERAFIVANPKGKSGLQTNTRTNTNRTEWNSWNDIVCSTECSWKSLSPHPNSIRQPQIDSMSGGLQQKQPWATCNSSNSFRESPDTIVSERNQVSESITERTPERFSKRERFVGGDGRESILPDWKTYPPQFCRMDDGIPPRVDKPRLQALGNAIVPRVIYPIFKAIAEIESCRN